MPCCRQWRRIKGIPAEQHDVQHHTAAPDVSDLSVVRPVVLEHLGGHVCGGGGRELQEHVPSADSGRGREISQQWGEWVPEWQGIKQDAPGLNHRRTNGRKNAGCTVCYSQAMVPTLDFGAEPDCDLE